jgi:hypothetical protein
MALRARALRVSAVPAKEPKTKNRARPGHAVDFELLQEALDSGTGLGSQVGADGFVDALRVFEDCRHCRRNRFRVQAGAAEHRGQNIRVEHAMDRDSFRRGFEAGDGAHGVDQRLSMMAAGAA